MTAADYVGCGKAARGSDGAEREAAMLPRPLHPRVACRGHCIRASRAGARPRPERLEEGSRPHNARDVLPVTGLQVADAHVPAATDECGKRLSVVSGPDDYRGKVGIKLRRPDVNQSAMVGIEWCSGNTDPWRWLCGVCLRPLSAFAQISSKVQILTEPQMPRWFMTFQPLLFGTKKRFNLISQVCQGTDSEKKDATVEILKQMKDVMELSKKTRLDLSFAAEPVKPLETPADGAPKDKHAGKVPSSEKSQVPPISLAGNVVPGGDVPLKPDNSDTAAHRLLVETKKGTGPSKTTDHTKQQGRLPQGSYVIGGSPIGWNFLLWPGRKAVYYGLTKEEWLARRSVK